MSATPWYAWYAADYNSKTSHLDFLHDAAYRRLLDAYYNRGGLLPADRGGLFRVTGAMSELEQAAVTKIVDEFFTIKNNKLCHKRADEELSKQGEIRKRLSEAGRRGGLLGGRGRNRGGLSEEIGVAKAKPQSQVNLTTLSGKPDPAHHNGAKHNGVSQEVLEILSFLNESAGRNYRSVKANTELIEARLRDGATPEEIKNVIHAKCAEWQCNEKMWRFLRPATLFNRTKFAQYQGEIGANMTKPQRTVAT